MKEKKKNLNLKYILEWIFFIQLINGNTILNARVVLLFTYMRHPRNKQNAIEHLTIFNVQRFYV